MDPSRRRFLIGSSAVLAGCSPTEVNLRRRRGDDTGDTGLSDETDTGTDPTTSWSWEPGPEPPRWNPDGTEDPVAFGYGAQSGDALLSGAILSVRTEEPEVELVVVRGVEEGWEEVQRLDGLVPDNRVVQLEIFDLVPDTTYAFAFYATDGVRRSSPARFRTALYPEATRLIRFGATSCLGGNEPWLNMTHAAAELYDFFVFLGDTVYVDNDNPQFERDWETALQVQGMRDSTQSTSVVGTWDDHEVRDNWRGDDADMPETGLAGLQAMRRALPMRIGGGSLSTLYRRLQWGDALELFVLDCRSERIGPDYISVEQMEWLKSGLLESTSRFKIVCNSVPICDMSDVYFGISADDRWDGYPSQRTEILGWIRDNEIEGVLWIAGDFHWGALATIGKPGEDFDDQYEAFCGPGGTFMNPLVVVINPNDHYKLVIKQNNYTAFEADPDTGTIRIAYIADNGSVIDMDTISI